MSHVFGCRAARIFRPVSAGFLSLTLLASGGIATFPSLWAPSLSSGAELLAEDKPSGGNNKIEDKPVDSKPGDKKPGDKKAEDKKKAEEKKSDDKRPAGNKASDKNPADNKPVDKKPEEKKPEEKKPSDKAGQTLSDKDKEKAKNEPAKPVDNVTGGVPAEQAPPKTQNEPKSPLDKIFAGGNPESVAELKLLQEHIKKLVTKSLPNTVGLRIGAAQGSGVIVSKDGMVLTAAHVIGSPGREATIVLPNGKTVKGKTLGLLRAVDAGMVKITDKNPNDPKGEWAFSEMGASPDVKVGHWCIALGHPGGYETGRPPVLRIGRILMVRPTVVSTDCTLVGGDSGGPLFDLQGKVIGIHSRISGPLVANMHVPIDPYHKEWQTMVKGDAIEIEGKPYIGVIGPSDSNDAKITELNAGGPAEKAGMKVGDIVTKFDGKEIKDFDTLAKLVSEKKPRMKIPLEVKRGSETIKLTLTIGVRPEGPQVD